MPFLHAGDRRHDLSRGAVAALERIVIDEGLLHRVEVPVNRRQALDGRDVATFELGHEQET